ncbi:E3 SUMO-protein ligase ZBED1-like [Odontesthes bonariensis]|uniref:E3 SUMO-protein ligase ZBED1-like n=1 Tax=Odontesthes bonariensis TaxID=219752 RepID=UPI003F58B087
MCDDKRANEITKRIVNMIVKDMLPLSVADGEGFRELMGFIEPGYRIPSRKTFTNRLEQQYAEKKAELKEKLASADVALTTDCWTALTTESYITVTCHYIEEDWQVKSAVLLTESFSDKHTADNLAEKLKESVDDWGLAGRVAACVHDNARNIVAANDPTRVSWQSLPCFAHTLQLAINDGFALDMHRVIAAAGRLVKHFHHSTPATRALEAKQEQLQLPKHRLIQSCKTRWNSVCDMFERLMEQRWAVTAVLSDRTVTKIQNARILEMKDEHWQLMEDSLPVLKALKCATTVLSSETEVSISSTYPITFSLINAHLKSDDGGHPKIEAFKNEVQSQLAKRMKVDSDNFPSTSPAMIAMILDPRHKHLGYLKPSQRLTLKNAVLDIAATTTVEQSDAADSAGSLPRGSATASAIAVLLGDNYTASPNEDTELDGYLKDRPPPLDTNPTDWWKNNTGRYPRLAKLAQRNLCIPATSVPSERVFSAAGLTVNRLRTRLTPEHVNMLIFMNKNT